MVVRWEVLLFLVAVHLLSAVFIFVLGDVIKESVYSKCESKAGYGTQQERALCSRRHPLFISHLFFCCDG
jgi:hypothetical protein